MEATQAFLAVEGDVEGSAVLTPAIYDIVWSAVAFAIILFLFWRFVLPQMQKALDARAEGIENKLEQAERDRAEAARLRADGQAQRASIVAEARTEAEQAARSVTEQAQARIATEAATAKASLQQDVGALASDLAERIVGEALDPARTAATIDRFIADLESAAPPAPAGGSD